MSDRMFLGGALAAVALLTIGAIQDRLPDGPGKPELAKVCSGCHDAETVLAHLKTPGEWVDTLQDMEQQGAEARPDEWRLIERYIDTNLAMILINKAPVDELQLTMDTTAEVARAIVKYRKENGAFKSVADVKKVSGIDAVKVDARTSRLVF